MKKCARLETRTTRCKLSRRDNRQGVLKLLILKSMTRNISYFAWRNVREHLALALVKIWPEEDRANSFADVSINANFYGRKRAAREIGSAAAVNASSIYPHERGGGISMPRFRFYRRPGYSTCERSCLTIHKVVPRSIAVPVSSSSTRNANALTSVNLCRTLPSGDGLSDGGDGGDCGHDDVVAWRLKQIFYEGSGVTAIIIKRWS